MEYNNKSNRIDYFKGTAFDTVLCLGGNMNKIFKLIWSKTKNCWVVASELAKGHAKSTSGRAKGSVLAASVLTVLLGSALFPMDAVYAADPVADGQTHYVSVGVKQGEKIKVRKNVYDANGHLLRVEEEEVEIDPTKNYNPPANPSVNFIGIGAELSQYGNGSVVVGFKSGAAEYGTALGTNARAGSLGDVAIGWQAFTSGFVGNKGQYTAPNKIAIGTQSTALEENGISIGTKSKTLDKNAIAIGNEAETGNEGGQSSNDSIAIGNKAKIQGQKNVAIGSGVTVGTGAKDNGSSYVVAIGSDSHAYDTDSIVIGGNSEVRENATVIGNRSKAGMESVALGSDIKAGEWSIAIGLSSKAHNHAIAMGMNSDVSGEYAIGIGEEARSFANQSVSMGYQAHAYVGESLAIGNSALVAGERISKEAYNALSDAEKKNYTYDSYGEFYYKNDNKSYYSTAVGPQARVYGKNATALGSANVGDIFGNIIADGGTAVGSSANAAYENATAVGYNSIAYAKDAVTLGANTRADIADGVALGSESIVGRYGRTDVDNAGRYGYDPMVEGRKQESPTWKSTKAAVSVGNKDQNITRQIVNVAAGSEDTDAVNVAQLKNVKYRAYWDLDAAEKRLNKGIQKNAGNISNLSRKVDGNTSSINNLKKQRDIDFQHLNQSIEGHTTRFVSINKKYTSDKSPNYRNTGAQAAGSIAIGVNAASDGEDAVTLGGNSFSRGQGSVIVGESSDNYNGGSETVKKGQFDQSIILGSNNTIFAQSAENGGREDKIIGNMNRVEESHGTFVRGTGNMVYDAYNDEALTDEDKQKEQDFLDPIDGGDPTGLFQKGRSHVTVEGDGNLVGGALYTQVSGVGNEVSNTSIDDETSTPRVTYNIVTGNRNTVVDSSHNLILGDNHELKNVNGNIIIGSQKTKTKTEKSNVTILGNDANVSVEGGVALGTGSVASTAAEVAGYDPLTGEASAKTTSTWKSGNGAVSVGTADKTRQITNLAAGLADTDAVNVAQLKNSKTAVEAGDYVTVTQKTEDGKGTTYTVNGPKLTSEDTNLKVTDEVDAGKKVGYKLQLSKTLTGLTSVTSDAFKVGDKTYINSKGINANNNKITNVAAGAADGDAVNFKQLSDVKTKVEANEGNITLNKNAIAGLTPKVAANEANITKLQAGFTVKDGGTGSANVTLGGDTKQEVTFKAAVDKTTQATENGSSLTSTVGTDRSVTYKLNMKQLKKDLGITDGPDGVMSSWKLKATGGDTTEQDIKNGEAVTFDVAAADKGLTVARDGKTIKYGIEGSKIDIANNQSITNLGKRIDNLPSIHYFSVKSTATGAGSNYDNDGAKKDGGIAIGKQASATGTSDIAIGTEAQATGGWGVAIGQSAKAQASTAVAMAFAAEAKGANSLAIGIQSEARTNDSTAYGREAKALGEVALAVGMRAKAEGDHSAVFGAEATTDSTAWNGTAIGRGAYIGKQAPDGTTPNIGVSDNYYTPVDDDTAVEAGKETKNSTAVGFGAKSFGYQNTALGAGAEAFDTNTVAVGVLSKAIGHYANALGKQARAEGTNSTAIGHFARALGESSMALGDYAITSTLDGTGKVNQSVALGSHARVAADNSLALGNNSLASIADDVKTEAYLSKEAFKKENGVVSVGNKEYTVGKEKIEQNYRRIINVAGGADDHDAVNVAQLKALEGKVTTNTGDITTLKEGWTLQDANTTVGTKTVKAKDTVTVTGDDYINATVNNAGLKLGMNETKLNTQINNQIDNSDTVKAKMNSWVLKATSDEGTEQNGKTINNTDNAVTFDVENDAQGLTVKRANSTIKYGIDKAKLASHITGDVITNINNGTTAVTNIAGLFSVTDGTNTKAVNLGKGKNNNVKFLGTVNETTVTVGGNDDAPTVTVGLAKEFKNKVTTNEKNIKELTGRVDTAEKTIKSNTDRIDTAEKTIKSNTAAIEKNAGDIKTLTTRVDANADNINANTEKIGKNTTAIENNTKAIAGKMTSWKLKAEGVAGEEEIKDGNAVTFDVAEKDQGLTVTRDGSTIKYGIDGSKIDIKENETVKKLEKDIENSKTTVKAGDGEKNISVSKTDGKNEYTITLAKDLKDLNSVSAKTVNADTVEASGKVTVGDKVTLGTTGLTIEKGPSVTAAGIDAGKKKITNVAAGAVSEKSTEAVNGGQLFGVEQKVNINSRNISILGGKVNELNARVDRVSAGTAALAALHPLDFDPDDKWDFAAGYGNYKGANAAAIGAYYRPNEDTMFSVGGSFGGGENMVNAGVSVKFGQGNHVTTSRIAMAKEIKDLRAEVEVLRQAVTGIRQGKTPDPVKMKLFPDIAKNHWAYEAVEKLTKQGLLEGYPDGTFGGDRMMTRYEFAEIVYRAVQKGLNVSEKLIQEFEPELERFRVDVISKDKDGNPVIERVRVNEKKRAK